MFQKLKKRKYSPTRVIFLSYLALILTGSILLYLPFSHSTQGENLPFLDCVFTATSAVCVTGLVVAPTALQWSLFGQIVILALIQVGGLSMVTIASFVFIVLGKKLGLRNRMLLQNTFNHTHLGGIVKLAKTVIKGTILFETSGAVLLTFYFFVAKKMPFALALYRGVFHAVSAFCNAGFDVLGTNSLINYSGDVFINIIIITLIVVGGIGFFVWEDVATKIGNKKHRLSLTSRLAIITTGFLLVSGSVYFFLAEYNNPETLGSMSLGHKILASVFQSATLRTAGFASINQYGLKESSKFISAIFMIIGGSPGGMAGGIKTVTAAIIFSSIWSVVRGRNGVRIFSRSISLFSLQKALAVSGIMLTLMFFFTALICVFEAKSTFTHTFIDILYECASALGTVGTTTGITPHLSAASKILLIASMVIGRVGPITVIYSLTKEEQVVMKYPEANVLIG